MGSAAASESRRLTAAVPLPVERTFTPLDLPVNELEVAVSRPLPKSSAPTPVPPTVVWSTSACALPTPKAGSPVCWARLVSVECVRFTLIVPLSARLSAVPSPIEVRPLIVAVFVNVKTASSTTGAPSRKSPDPRGACVATTSFSAKDTDPLPADACR